MKTSEGRQYKRKWDEEGRGEEKIKRKRDGCINAYHNTKIILLTSVSRLNGVYRRRMTEVKCNALLVPFSPVYMIAGKRAKR